MDIGLVACQLSVPTCVLPQTHSIYSDRTFAVGGPHHGTLFRSSWTVQTTAEGTPFLRSMTTALCDF